MPGTEAEIFKLVRDAKVGDFRYVEPKAGKAPADSAWVGEHIARGRGSASGSAL